MADPGSGAEVVLVDLLSRAGLDWILKSTVEDFGIAPLGTVIATMPPHSIAFMLAWMVPLVAWLLLGLSLGPGAGLFLE